MNTNMSFRVGIPDFVPFVHLNCQKLGENIWKQIKLTRICGTPLENGTELHPKFTISILLKVLKFQ